MKPKHIRAFYIGRQRFHVTDRGDGTLQVSSIHPYDETDYHWAYQASKSCWHICREGRKVCVVPNRSLTARHRPTARRGRRLSRSSMRRRWNSAIRRRI